MSKRMPHIGFGAASLMVIFTVLCLTIFSLLTLLTAKNEYALTERTAQNVQDYYAADVQAVKIRRAVETALAQDALPPSIDGVQITHSGGEIRYQCPIGSSLRLSVTLVHTGGGVTAVRAWQTEPAADWQADDSIEVWDGEGS